jgi:hypothetical protein
MMEKKALFAVMVCLCLVAAAALTACSIADKEVQPVRANFVPSPEFSPPYPPLPHHFNNQHSLQILCRASKGAIRRALALPPVKNATRTQLNNFYTRGCFL